MKWTVIATVDVPNLAVGQGPLPADTALALGSIMESSRGTLQRKVTMTVEAADEEEASRVALEQLTSGFGAELAGVPEVESIHIEPDE
jgi:hypothetical protein